MGEFSPVLQQGGAEGAGRAVKGAEVHGTLGQLPVTSFLFLLHSPGSASTFPASCSDTGLLRRQETTPRDQAAWASSRPRSPFPGTAVWKLPASATRSGIVSGLW